MIKQKKIFEDIKNKLNKELEIILKEIKEEIQIKYKNEQITLNKCLNSYYAWQDFIMQGKRLRPILTIISALAFGAKESKELFRVALSVELLHNSTLIHDDWMDEDVWRRGKQTTHEKCRKHYENSLDSKYFKNNNIKKAITEATLIGNIILSEGYLLLAKSKLPNSNIALKDLINTYKEINEGQLFDIQQDLDFDAYLVMIKQKTAILFSCAAKIGVYLANKPEEVENISKAILPVARAFQIQDDILDLSLERGEKQGSDIRSGKKNAVSLFFEKNSDKEQKEEFQNFFGKQNLTKEEINKVIILLKETQTIQKIEKYKEKLLKESLEKIKTLKIDEEHKRNISDFLKFLVFRDW